MCAPFGLFVGGEAGGYRRQRQSSPLVSNATGAPRQQESPLLILYIIPRSLTCARDRFVKSEIIKSRPLNSGRLRP